MDLIPQKYAREEREAGVFILLLALGAALLFHGGLSAFTHGNTYDAYIHMFFADSYNRSWFDTWEPRWYTGFSTTSYPPGTHMIMGAFGAFDPFTGRICFRANLRYFDFNSRNLSLFFDLGATPGSGVCGAFARFRVFYC